MESNNFDVAKGKINTYSDFYDKLETTSKRPGA